MIKITPILPARFWIRITDGHGIPLSLSVLKLSEERIRQIAKDINSLRDDSCNQVAFLTVVTGEVKFFLRSSEQVCPNNFTPQFLKDLKSLEIDISRNHDELRVAQERWLEDTYYD